MTLRFLAGAAILLSGCALLEPRPDAVDRVVADAVAASRAAGPEQKAALASAQAAFNRDASSTNRLRLAALFALLPAPLRDDARALDLLEPLAKTPADGQGRLAALLWTQVAERQRLAREVDRLARDVRERERADKERDKREEELRRQLEAMQSIERGILEREEKLRRRPR